MNKHIVLRLVIWTTLALISVQAAADPGSSATVAREYRQAHEQQLVDEFAALLSLPNVATDGVAIRKNAEYIAELLRPRKFQAELLEAPGSPPVVFAERLSPGADKTLMIYVHYDGQAGIPLSVNLKLFFEGEEEQGSPLAE